MGCRSALSGVRRQPPSTHAGGREDDLAGLALLLEGRTATGSAYLLVRTEEVT
jgi:hypothetical protein